MSDRIHITIDGLVALIESESIPKSIKDRAQYVIEHELEFFSAGFISYQAQRDKKPLLQTSQQ